MWESKSIQLLYLLVAPAGRARKGTAMGPGYRMLQELGIKLASERYTRSSYP